MALAHRASRARAPSRSWFLDANRRAGFAAAYRVGFIGAGGFARVSVGASRKCPGSSALERRDRANGATRAPLTGIRRENTFARLEGAAACRIGQSGISPERSKSIRSVTKRGPVFV